MAFIRSRPVTASALSLPDCTSGMAVETLPNIMSTVPETRSTSAGDTPL